MDEYEYTLILKFKTKGEELNSGEYLTAAHVAQEIVEGVVDNFDGTYVSHELLCQVGR